MELSPNEMNNLKRNFIDVGKTIKATLNSHQFGAVVTLSGFKATDEENLLLLHRADPKGTNAIGWSEVVDSAKELKRMRKEARDRTRAKAIEECRKIDKVGTGYLSSVDLVLAFSTGGMRLSPEQRQAALEEEMKSSDMTVNYEDFIEKHVLE